MKYGFTQNEMEWLPRVTRKWLWSTQFWYDLGAFVLMLIAVILLSVFILSV